MNDMFLSLSFPFFLFIHIYTFDTWTYYHIGDVTQVLDSIILIDSIYMYLLFV